jgi:signal transduction histidine kinase/ABC-type amino acid transport substrate-binding protein
MSKFLIYIFLIFGVTAKDLKFLNKEEIEWLKLQKNPIRVGVTIIPNQVLFKSDKSKAKLTGFSIELLNLIAKKLNLKFKYIYFNSWKRLLNSAKKGNIDIVFLAQKTASRLKYLYFTDTILTQQNRLITTLNRRFSELKDLNGKRVAITAGSAIEDFLKSFYPDIKVTLTKGEKESLELVSKGRVDATILEPIRASYYIQKYNLNNLTISGDINYNYYLSIASTKREPQLNIILNKTLKSIKESEIKALKLKWGYIKDKILFFDRQTLIYLAIAFGIIIPFSIYLFVINRRLQMEMREKEIALEKVVKLRDSKLNEISQTISMIAHQWKQPLNNLSILIQMLIVKYKRGSLDEKLIEYFGKESRKQIELMSRTIDDFRDFFKVSDKKEEFNLKETIQNIIKLVSPVFEKDNIKIEFLCDEREFKVVNYQSMIFQIVLNIVNNAKDAIIERGIKSGVIKIELKETKSGTLILIEDNAGGVDEAVIDKIFDPYFSTKKGGTGLGLYIAKVMLEERLNGEISLKNGKKGAIFEIKLF